ncbi:MAG: transposase [Raoultibacter sp.]|jgi:hypothetical protein
MKHRAISVGKSSCFIWWSAPKKKTSGTSVNKKKKAKGGNRRLKNALIQSAQRVVDCDQHCKDYYEKKRAEERSTNQFYDPWRAGA